MGFPYRSSVEVGMCILEAKLHDNTPGQEVKAGLVEEVEVVVVVEVDHKAHNIDLSGMAMDSLSFDKADSGRSQLQEVVDMNGFVFHMKGRYKIALALIAQSLTLQLPLQ